MPWSQTTEYALRAMVAIAAHRESLTTAEIARTAGIPSGYLSKVLQTLGRADLVRAQRGLGGGFTLARAPDAITVLHVVDAVDPLRRIRECPLGVAGHGAHLCKLHQRMDDALAALELVFAETRLSDLLREAGESPLCQPVVRPAQLVARTHGASPAHRVERARRGRPAAAKGRGSDRSRRRG